MPDRVTFTRQSADRIAKVVRKVEAGNRDTVAMPTAPRGVAGGGNGKVFRVGTFTGAWAINTGKTVTFKNQTATPNTASVTNYFFDFPQPNGTVDCGIAKEGTAWFLIDVPFETATAVIVTGTAASTYATGTGSQSVVTGISISGVLNTSNCAITINSTVSTASIVVLSSTASAVTVTGTQTATIVRFKVN
jgi:hypothetical protein